MFAVETSCGHQVHVTPAAEGAHEVLKNNCVDIKLKAATVLLRAPQGIYRRVSSVRQELHLCRYAFAAALAS